MFLYFGGECILRFILATEFLLIINFLFTITMTDFKRNNNKRKVANRRTAIHKEIVAIRKVYYSSHRIVSNDSASSETSDDDTLNVSVDLVGHRKIPDFDSTKLFIFVSATQIYVEGVKYNNVREFNIFESKYNHKELSSENIWECIYNSVNVS